MPGRAHETLVEALHDRPTLFAALVYALTGHTMPPELEPVDSTIRFVKVDEVRPDILYESAPGWTITEVQNDIDPEKQRRWLLAAAVLFNQTGFLGDVYVITAERPVATWALTVAHLETPRGTKLALTPVVLHVSSEVLDHLLTEEHPELALVATWAVSHRHGPKAKKVVERAIELTERLPPLLQKTQRDAILNLLSERMLAWLKEKAMNPKSRLSPAVLEFKAAIGGPYRAEGLAEGRAEGERKALLMLLGSRGLSTTAEERATIEGCSDPAVLDRWFLRAVTAGSVAEVLGTNEKAQAAVKPKAAKPRVAKPRAAKPRTPKPRAGA